MDTVALVSGLLSAQTAQIQTAVTARLMKMNADSARAVADMLVAGQANLNRLANVAAGTGTNLDISV